MLTHDRSGSSGRPGPSGAVRWAVPGVAAAIGLGYLVAGLAGGRPGFGVGGLVLMLVVGAGFVLATRVSETAAGLADRTDERINSIDRDASLVAGMVLLAAVLVMFMVEVARGDDGSPYYQLGALAGVSYLAALAWLRVRR
jgi:hypothetical protein